MYIIKHILTKQTGTVIYWTTLITAFVILESPYVSKAILGSDLTIQPVGYSFMYLYAGLLLLFLLSGIQMYRGYTTTAWLLLLPSIITAFLGYIDPTIHTSLEHTYLHWFVLGVGLWLLVKTIGQRVMLNVSPFRKYFTGYERLFSVHEFKNSQLAPYLLIASIAFLVFALKNPALSIVTPLQVGEYICPIWFQNCYEYYIFSEYGYHIWSIVLMLFLSGALVAVLSRRLVLGHMLLLVPAVWHIVLVGLLTHNDFYYGHVMFYVCIINFILLFLPNKIMTVGWVLMMTYILSLSSKMNDSWLGGGEIFKSLDLGLPIVGDQLHTPLALTVIAIHGGIIWLLLSKKPLRYIAIGALFIFHIYSVVLIQYFFPAVAVVILLIVFLGHECPIHWPAKRLHQIIIIGLTALLILGQSVSLVIPGDSRLTREGVRFGLHMFQALPWCYITTSIRDQDNTESVQWWEEERMGYCRPYYQWYVLKQRCLHNNLKSALLTMDIAINLEPYRRVLDEVNVCAVEYHPLRHNPWILIDRENLETVPYDTIRRQGIL